MKKYLFFASMLSLVLLNGVFLGGSKLFKLKKEVISGKSQMVTIKHLEEDYYSVEFLTVNVHHEDSKSRDCEWLASFSREYPSDEMFERWSANKNFRVLKESFIIRPGEFNIALSEKTVIRDIEAFLSGLLEDMRSGEPTNGQDAASSSRTVSLPGARTIRQME